MDRFSRSESHKCSETLQSDSRAWTMTIGTFCPVPSCPTLSSCGPAPTPFSSV